MGLEGSNSIPVILAGVQPVGEPPLLAAGTRQGGGPQVCGDCLSCFSACLTACDTNLLYEDNKIPASGGPPQVPPFPRPPFHRWANAYRPSDPGRKHGE